MSDECGCGDGATCGCGPDRPTGRLPGDPGAFSHRAILRRMLDRVAQAEVEDRRPLRSWTTRSLDDPGIALLSAQAGAGQVLAWNLRRQYADGTLTQGEDPDSLLLLTRLLGHQRRPAIAASTVLSFELEVLDGAPEMVTVPQGTQVSTIAEPDEDGPQVFETGADLEARRTWNSLAAFRPPAPQTITAATTSVVLAGVGHPVRVGDHLLVWKAPGVAGMTWWVQARVTAVETDTGSDTESDPGTDTGATAPTTTVRVSGGKLLETKAFNVPGGGDGTVVILGDRAMPFGATAPDITFMPQAVRDGKGTGASKDQWAAFVVFDPVDGSVDLDTVHAAAAVDRVAVFVPPAPTATVPICVTRIASAIDTARSDFGLSARCTRLTVDSIVADIRTQYDTLVRTLSILLETARATLVVPLADPELPTAAQPDRLTVVGLHDLPPGRRVVLAGTDTATGLPTAEAAVVAACTPSAGAGSTLVKLDGPLVHRYRASTLKVLANCVPATQGESAPPVPSVPGADPRAEVLGSGDPSAPLPRYRLTRSRLAHVPAPGPVGYAPAISVRVDARTYDRVDRLTRDDPASREFRVLAREGEGAEVQFGGRLPSGAGNITATYRTGGGSAGNLAHGRLVQAITPVLGVRTVSNPVPAEGGSDAETAAEMRETAPRAIRTLGRAVALSDFAAFAEGYRGVGRADATELRLGRARTIVVTVATTTFAPPAAGAALLGDLGDAIEAAAPPGTKVMVVGFEDLAMSVRVAFAHDPHLRRTDVEEAVRAGLLARFGAPVRPFARAVHRSEVLATVQDVPGVVAVRLVTFSSAGAAEDAQGRLPCPGPRVTTGGTGIQVARRLSLAATGIQFEELTP